jgi:hypothetical protein
MGADGVGDAAGHVRHQRLEHRLLGVEIGVETAQRDAGAGGDAADRSALKPPLAELGAGGVENRAQRAAAAVRAWRFRHG